MVFVFKGALMNRFILACLALAVAAGATLAAQNGRPTASNGAHPYVPVTDEMLWKPDPANWLSWRRTLDGWGYSPLDQIDRNNVARLKMVWTRGMGAGTVEATPLVYDGVMYLPGPGDVIQAINAKSGDQVWEYKRKLPEGINGGTNRNIAMWGSTLIDGSADNQIYAVDVHTGNLVWETAVMEAKKRARASAGPIIANGKVITGRQCQPDAGNDACIITAHDAATGKEVWRTRTIPLPGEPGYETWGDVPMAERWHVGTWMVPSYDPETNRIFVGTSVTIPAPKFILAGNDKTYLYHNSTLALDADTGKIVWHYQHLVDHWDLDHPFERLLVETAITPDPKEVAWINPKVKPGERRKVVTGIPGKTGVVYTLDRQTGEFLWARPTVAQTVVRRIDGATGEVIVNEDTVFTADKEERFICPNTAGGKNWEAGAYSPLTNAMYFPLQNTCMQLTSTGDKTSLYAINAKPQIATAAGNMAGSVQAISVETGAIMWKYQQRAGTTSLVATASGLLFGGDVNGRFRALDQATGKVLWETNLGSADTGYPITFAIDGEQYVAVSTGSSLATGGIAALTPELKPSNANNLFVFTLPN